MSLLPAFLRHPEAGRIVGTLVTAYGELEFLLAHCIGEIIDNRDVAFKVMFRARGEEQRVILADALARPILSDGAYKTAFEQTIAALRYCLKIRNQYAHCAWGDDARGLWFVALEENAKDNGPYDLTELTQHVLSLDLLHEQEAFFAHTKHRLEALNLVRQHEAGKISVSSSGIPTEISRPALRL